MEMFVLEELLNRWACITLFCRANDMDLGPQVFRTPGNHTWVRDFPSTPGTMLHLNFRIDHALEPGEFE